MSQANILISACLLGNPVRYNGTSLFIDHPLLKQWQQQKRLIKLCPEVAGGMSVPRSPAEIINGDGTLVLSKNAKVIDRDGVDVTHYFILGAKSALQTAKDNNCVAAILTERSPSCGSHQIYNGSFSATLKIGMGVTSALLAKNNIRVFSQHQLEEVDLYLRRD